MKNKKQKEILIEQLKKFPIIQVACEKSGVGRATFYRWRAEDKQFKKAAEKALTDGEDFITDMSESQLITMIREKNFQAVHLWLKHHHPKYSTTVELIGNLRVEDEPLSPEQQMLVETALKLAGLQLLEELKSQNENENNTIIKSSE